MSSRHDADRRVFRPAGACAESAASGVCRPRTRSDGAASAQHKGRLSRRTGTRLTDARMSSKTRIPPHARARLERSSRFGRAPEHFLRKPGSGVEGGEGPPEGPAGEEECVSGVTPPLCRALSANLKQFCGVLGHTFMEFLKGSGDYCQAQHAAYADE
ncbi:hypothetical protein FQA47_018283 [Oryzias melastigma]|uniref:Uncharacterized protein n=1 Tax=Oryzias melastigma TaxID=30732 RepID=A0A834L190_ORYME|nr:hypothetical protein FQA47_018283 [Oryzias melastigma]